MNGGSDGITLNSTEPLIQSPAIRSFEDIFDEVSQEVNNQSSNTPIIRTSSVLSNKEKESLKRIRSFGNNNDILDLNLNLNKISNNFKNSFFQFKFFKNKKVKSTNGITISVRDIPVLLTRLKSEYPSLKIEGTKPETLGIFGAPAWSENRKVTRREFMNAFLPWYRRKLKKLNWEDQEKNIINQLDNDSKIEEIKAKRWAQRTISINEKTYDVSRKNHLEDLYKEFANENNISMLELTDLIMALKEADGINLIDGLDDIFTILRKWDIDGDGKISLEEFLENFDPWFSSVQVEPIDSDISIIESGSSTAVKGNELDKSIIINNLFDEFDSDGNGTLSLNEVGDLIHTIRKAHRKVLFHSGLRATKRLFREWDKNGDGNISRQEFLECFGPWWEKMISRTPKAKQILNIE